MSLLAFNIIILIIVVFLGTKLYGYYRFTGVLLRLIGRAAIGYIRIRYRDGMVLEMNDGSLDILDLTMSKKDLLKHDISKFFVNAEEGNQAGLREELVQNQGDRRDRVYHLRTLAGNEKWILYNAQLLRDRYSGELVVHVLIENITREEESYQDLVRSEERYEKLFKNLGDMVILYDFKNKIVEEVNPVTEEITGYSGSELIGRSFERLIHPSYRTGLLEKQEELMFTGVVRLKAVIVCKDGTYKEVWLTLSTFRIRGKKIIMTVIKDISELVREREEQNKRRDELERFRRASIEREERIKRLREELNRAKRQIDSSCSDDQR